MPINEINKNFSINKNKFYLPSLKKKKIDPKKIMKLTKKNK